MRAIPLLALLAAAAFLGTPRASAAPPSLGPNVVVLNPSMPQSAIQATLDGIATQQVHNEFGTQRNAVFFEPGTYGSAAHPLAFQLGYYTQVAGLGATPAAVTINGAVSVYNQCPAGGGACEGLTNFWRSLSNLTLNVTLPTAPPNPPTGEDAGCNNSNDLFAVSQAAPVRNVIVNGNVFLQDYCNQGFVSGGFFANDQLNGFTCNCGQQQFFVRNSVVANWSNGVWNQVFMGDVGAPAEGTGPYTTLASTPVSQEPPYLTDAGVFLPAVQHDSVGTTYGNGMTIPYDRFTVANPATPVSAINSALARGQSLILTPGVYHLAQPIRVVHPDTIVLGLGLPTLVPTSGNAALQTIATTGVKVTGLIVDAGPVNSPVLVQIGNGDNRPTDANDPTVLADVFLRIGGATPGRATTALVVNADDAILDDLWVWRADHGNGVGWTLNTAETGVVVNGDNVSAYGLFVEHFQKNEVIWNGQNGTDVFFQNEMPYDVPAQAGWDYPAFLVSPGVTSFHGYGMGSYSFFNQGIDIFATQAFTSPTTPGVQFHNLLTIFLDASHGKGGILSVINGVGGSSTIANPDVPVVVANYP